MTKWRAFTQRSPFKIWSNFLAWMLCREPRSFSGLVNLEEAGEISIMITDAALQRPLLRLQTSKQRKKSGSNQGLLPERFWKVLASEWQRPCPYCIIIVVSENDVRSRSPIRWQTNNDGLELSGASSCCESSTEAVQNWPGKYWHVKKLGSIDMIWKPRCSQRFGCFRTSPLPPKLKRSRSAQKKQSLRTGTCITVSRRSSRFGTNAAQRRDSVAFFFVMTMPVRTHQQQRLTFSMRTRCSYCRTHRVRKTSLPASPSRFQKWRTTEGYPVWVRRRCPSSVHEDSWRHTQIKLGWLVVRSAQLLNGGSLKKME